MSFVATSPEQLTRTGGRSADRLIELLDGGAGKFELFRLGTVVKGHHRCGSQLGLLFIDVHGAVQALRAKGLGSGVIRIVGDLV